MQDVRYAAALVRGPRPDLHLVATLTMALGIGATTATFSVVDATLLHPLPYPQADRLVSVESTTCLASRLTTSACRSRSGSISSGQALRHVALAWFDENNLTGASRPAQVRLMSVTPNYFAVLGIAPQLGRTFPCGGPFARLSRGEIVISDGLWKGAFGGDPHILDRSIRLDTDLYRIVGVMPPGFHAPGRTVGRAERRMSGRPRVSTARRCRISRRAACAMCRARSRGWRRTRRLRPRRAEIDALVARLRRQYPEDYPDRSGWTVRLVPLQDTVVGDVRRSLILLLGAVGLVLLIGCVNVANLLLARASARGRELAVRQAIGAGANRLTRQVADREPVPVGCIGGAAGIAVRIPGEGIARAPRSGRLPRLNDITLNWSVLLFAAGRDVCVRS